MTEIFQSDFSKYLWEKFISIDLMMIKLSPMS